MTHNYEKKSNWERYFSDKIVVENLSEKWNQLYKYRNAVAHSKKISIEDYNKATALIKEMQVAFIECIQNIDTVELNEEESEAVQQVARETISQESIINDSLKEYRNLGELHTRITVSDFLVKPSEYARNLCIHHYNDSSGLIDIKPTRESIGLDIGKIELPIEPRDRGKIVLNSMNDINERILATEIRTNKTDNIALKEGTLNLDKGRL